MTEPSDVCFVGLGASALCLYRCLLPAMALGADWVGLTGEPPDTGLATGLVGGETKRPDLSQYKVVIIQQARGRWLEVIRWLRSLGVVVLYEVDDNLHAIERQRGHDFRYSFTRAELASFEACMRECDGMIVSTPYLDSAYRKFNKRRYVCENGIDPARYAYTRPAHETIDIGWAGATGHREAVIPWVKAAADVMRRHERTRFVSIGQPYADGFKEHFPAERALSIPWCSTEQYPAAMTTFDIALAPALRNGFYLGKSDLRWLEASALGIPVIGHPAVYRSIEDGVTGFLADHPAKVVATLERLVRDAELRQTVGEQARRHVLSTRAFPGAVAPWIDAIERAVQAAARRRAA